AHEVAVARERLLALEHLHDHRTRGHVAHQILEERTLAMHGIEALGLALRQVQHARGDDRESGLLEAAVHLADEIATDTVGFDDGQRALERHSMGPSVLKRRIREARGQARKFTWLPPPRQFAVQRKCRFGKAFLLRAGGAPQQSSSGPQTEKLSPQPHSPLTFGLRKRKASFSPSLTKSTIVPSTRSRLSRSTKQRT